MKIASKSDLPNLIEEMNTFKEDGIRVKDEQELLEDSNILTNGLRSRGHNLVVTEVRTAVLTGAYSRGLDDKMKSPFDWEEGYMEFMVSSDDTAALATHFNPPVKYLIRWTRYGKSLTVKCVCTGDSKEYDD